MVTVLIGALLVSGCATGYKPNGLTGGFDDSQLAPDTFRITFLGNGMTSPGRANDFALLRSADLTLKNGFSFFGIVNESSQTHEESVTLPATQTTSGSVVANSNGYYDAQGFGTAMANYNQTTTYTPGQTFTSTNPEIGLLIRCFKEKQTGFYTFDATFLEKSLRAKYALPPYKG